MTSAPAFAKINLALVVGPLRGDGKHEVVTVLQRIDLCDEITLAPARELAIEGFADDTLVRSALEALADAARAELRWRVHIEKRIPVGAGLGGGSSDAAAAIALANETLDRPLSNGELHTLAAGIGADVPFFLLAGTQLATGDGTELERVELPFDYSVLLIVPFDQVKASTRAVYDDFDARDGASGFSERASALRRALGSLERSRDLALLPSNDLASSPIALDLVAEGAFRADVSGAGPTVYGIFEHHDVAVQAADRLAHLGRAFVARPVEAGDLPRVAR